MTDHTYKTPAAFRQALEDRIRREATGVDVQRRRQLVVFSRLLARLQKDMDTNMILKGGFALELRLEHARTTRDIDLMLLGPEGTPLVRLQSIGQLDLDDYMTFEIQADSSHPELTGDGVRYGGKRYRVECKLAGKTYGARFGLDIVFGGKMFGTPTMLATEPYLEFAGIQSPLLSVLPVETHIAEKLHAYTLPRTTTNMRVRDLPDLALLATSNEPSLISDRIRQAIHQTFDFRGTHAVPAAFPNPPPEWMSPYEELAAEQRLRWKTLDSVTEAARAFLDPILRTEISRTWNVTTWDWGANEIDNKT